MRGIARRCPSHTRLRTIQASASIPKSNVYSLSPPSSSSLLHDNAMLEGEVTIADILIEWKSKNGSEMNQSYHVAALRGVQLLASDLNSISELYLLCSGLA
jgi:hypothetical protein